MLRVIIQSKTNTVSSSSFHMITVNFDIFVECITYALINLLDFLVDGNIPGGPTTAEEVPKAATWADVAFDLRSKHLVKDGLKAPAVKRRRERVVVEVVHVIVHPDVHAAWHVAVVGHDVGKY